MHFSALRNAKLFFDTYVAGRSGVTVVDIGAQDVNGSLRLVAPRDVTYVGVDFVKGNGVDVVLDDPYTLPFEDASLDVVVSSSCFEHSEMFWVLFLEILRVLKPAGLLYVNAPSNGYFHRWPVDCWRFYPDAGRALVTWAKRNGGNPLLLESYISKQDAEDWSDFVGVFLKDESTKAKYSRRIVHSNPRVLNATIDGRDGVQHFAERTEDQSRLRLSATYHVARLMRRVREMMSGGH